MAIFSLNRDGKKPVGKNDVDNDGYDDRTRDRWNQRNEREGDARVNPINYSSNYWLRGALVILEANLCLCVILNYDLPLAITCNFNNWIRAPTIRVILGYYYRYLRAAFASSNLIFA